VRGALPFEKDRATSARGTSYISILLEILLTELLHSEMIKA